MEYGSVKGSCQLTPNVAAAAMAMTIARSEQNYQLLAFSKQLVPVDLTAQMSLEQVCHATAEVGMWWIMKSVDDNSQRFDLHL